MITLRITSKNETREASFNQKEIFIGPQGSSLCELGIADPTLNDPHCKILFNNDRYTIVNSSDDPDVTVDGLAFGKRSLNKGSKISIRNTLIEVLSTEEINQELDLLLREVETLSTEAVEEDEETPVLPTPKPMQSIKKRWMAIPTLFFLLIIGFFSLQSYMHAQKDKLEMEAALKLSDHAMNQLSKRLTGEALHNRKFSSNVYTLKSEDSILTAIPTSKIYQWFGNLEPVSINLNTFTLYKGEGKESISLEDLSASFPDKSFDLAPNAKSLSPKSTLVVYNAPRYSAITSYFEDLNDPDFITFATLPSLIIYTTLERADAKKYGREITAKTKSPLLVAYRSGNEYLITKVKFDKSQTLQAPPILNLNAKLTEIQRERTESLNQITTDIQNLISQNSSKPLPNTKKTLLALLRKYEKQDAESQEKMKEQVLDLYQSYVIENKELNQFQFKNTLISEGYEGFFDNPQ